MPSFQTYRSPWNEPPLFEPDWIVIDLRLNVVASDSQVWGGLQVWDGSQESILAMTAQAFPRGELGLVEAMTAMFNIAKLHLENGDPFPPDTPWRGSNGPDPLSPVRFSDAQEFPEYGPTEP